MWAGGSIALASALVAFGWWLRRPGVDATTATSVNRFTWSLPPDIGVDSAPAVSPDGRHIAFTGVGPSGQRLYVRAMNAMEATPVAGTDGARHPFWSPDGRSIGYFARGKLMKITLAGGAPVQMADAPDGRGGAWSSSGVIVFSPMLIDAPLMKVSAEGGSPEPATVVQAGQGDNSHRWPAFLPDGVHFVYFVRSSADERRGVYLGRLDRPHGQADPMLFRSESQAVFASSSDRDRGVLLSVTDGRIEARVIDTARVALRGDPEAIDLPVGSATPYHPAMLAASTNVLTTVPSAPSFGARLASIGRNGEEPRYLSGREVQNWPRLSGDGQWVARQVIDPVRGNPDIWVENLERGTRNAVTAGPEDEAVAVWSPDGKRMAYVVGQRTPEPRLVIAAADGTGVIGEVACPEPSCTPTDWSVDGKFLIANVRRARSVDVWLLPVVPDERARPILDAPYAERDARMSPDGRWIAYVSEESGRPEVSVRSFVGPRQRAVMSAGGGDQPVWRGDGSELFFVDLTGRLSAVSVRPAPGGALSFSAPVPLKVPRIGPGHNGTQYDVTRDGGRIFFRDVSPEPPPREMSVILGWQGLVMHSGGK
jgi:eukaryotic-like serine/threonine-protein kinase